MVVLVYIRVFELVTLLVPTSAFRLVAHLGRERFLVCAYMDGGTWYVSFHKNLV